jgi:hypothetical protein
MGASGQAEGVRGAGLETVTSAGDDLDLHLADSRFEVAEHDRHESLIAPSADERDVKLSNASQDTPKGDRIAREAYVVPARGVPVSMSVSPEIQSRIGKFATISPAEPGVFSRASDRGR